ncbi:hypothetical protein [Acetivibrio cellulolyticus]|uniref:hypothetical protein n=1 Tax=Acetivibrio cellulolyticus TaxID=35830 RepID=UPI0001E2C741|nr:hypothetical protein [Acetivibrio cellulolyticus]
MLFNKKVPDKKDLLKELDLLGYSDRVKKMAIMGRDNNSSKQYHKLLSSLLEDGAYEAQLALTGASVTKNTDIILSALKHRMVSVRKKAAGLLAKAASDDDIVKEIENLSQDCRRCLLRNITKINRQVLAERLIGLVYKRWGAHEAAILLPACSKETVEKYLLDIGHVISSWHMLAYRNLDVVSDYFKTSLEKASSRQKTYIWWWFSTAIQLMCELKPDFILDCAMNLGPKDIVHPLLKTNIGILVRKCPEKVYDLLVRNESRKELISNGIPTTLLKNLKCFSKDQQIGLGKLLAEKPAHIAEFLHHIAPSDREDLFEAVYEKEIRKEIVFPEALLYELPHKLRDREAARMLGLRQINESRAKTYMITLYRDIDNAREILQTAARSSNAEERAQALTWLIRSTALSRHGVDETLAFLCRIKNEQDPVRSAVFTELSKCNASIYTENNIKELTLLVDSVIEARDTSYSTRYAVQKFAFAIMIHNASNPGGELFKFSMDITKKLTKQTGQLAFPSLEKNIPRGLEKNIFDEIYPLVVDANRHENYSMVIALAAALGKRGYEIIKLQNLLKEAIAAKPDNVAIQAARHWLAPKKTRDERVKELIGLDKSFITIPQVFLHLHMRRQEWLDPFISGDVIRGKFLTGNTIYVVPADKGFQRWLPRQQNSLLCMLERIASDSKRSQWERVNCIKIMARMPDICPTKVIKFMDSNEVPIVEAALYATSLLEEPEKSIPILLENIDGDRARVAMYSIPKCARFVNPDLLSSKLNELLSRDNLKITVRKEAIRLVGAYKSINSLSLLMGELKKANPHKDVLIAVGHAARQLLDNKDAWCVLNELASSSQIDVARSLLYQQPDQLQEDFRTRYLELIIRVANYNEADVRKEAFSYMKQWINRNEETVANAALAAITDLECSSVWNAATDTLIEACCDGKVNEVVINVFKDLVNVDIIEEYNANAQRDLPHRQRLMKLVSKLTSLPSSTRLNLVPLYKGIIECFSKEKTLKNALIKVHVASIDWNDVENSIIILNNIVNCIIDYPHLINNAYNEVLQNLKDNKGYWEPETLLKIVDMIWHKGCREAQYISLALLEVAGSTLFWHQDCGNRLKLYRNYNDVMICTRALDIWTAIE